MNIEQRMSHILFYLTENRVQVSLMVEITNVIRSPIKFRKRVDTE